MGIKLAPVFAAQGWCDAHQGQSIRFFLIPPERETAHAMQKHDLVSEELPQYAVITNSTCDGLCYNVSRVIDLLDDRVDRLHFGEAWYSYARVHPLYKDRCAMHGDPADYNLRGAPVFST